MTTIYSTPLEEQLKEAQRTASRLETENAALKQQLVEQEAWEPVSIEEKSNLLSRAQFRGITEQGFALCKLVKDTESK